MLVTRRRAGLAACLTATALLAAGCGGASKDDSPVVSVSVPASDYKGAQLSPGIPLGAAGDIAFTSDEGSRTTLKQLQSDSLLLVYFGYTHCPDVCPTTMADIGQALKDSPQAIRDKTQVVFVTSDPDRDTPAAMHTWLANFDSGLPHPFVGLTGSLSDVDRAAGAFGIPLSPPKKQSDGTITVDHGAQVLAFAKGQANVAWLAGTPVADYATALATLTKGTT